MDKLCIFTNFLSTHTLDISILLLILDMGKIINYLDYIYYFTAFYALSNYDIFFFYNVLRIVFKLC